MNPTVLIWIVDIVVVGILVTGLIIGCKQGAFNLIIYRMRKILAFVGAVFLAKPLGKWIADRILMNPVKNFVMSKIPEGEEFMAPEDSDAVLTMIYGDYMTMPPENERNWHNAEIIEE